MRMSRGSWRGATRDGFPGLSQIGSPTGRNFLGAQGVIDKLPLHLGFVHPEDRKLHALSKEHMTQVRALQVAGVEWRQLSFCPSLACWNSQAQLVPVDTQAFLAQEENPPVRLTIKDGKTKNTGSLGRGLT